MTPRFRMIASLVALCVFACVQVAGAGTVSGIVTAGGVPVVGATVRTSGQPTYSAVTGTDGRYSLSLPATTGSWTVCASSAGYAPLRVAVYADSGSSLTVNYPMQPANTLGQSIQLPAPLSYGAPPSAPQAPGDNYPVVFSDTASSPAPGAPVISGWHETLKPDESFTLTGLGFTTRSGADAGTDTTVWVWARTSSSGGALRQAKLWRVTDTTIVASIPDDAPFGMYLIWVESANGASAPVCVNRTTAEWIGPLDTNAYPGATKRVFGRNLTYNHAVTRTGSSDPITAYVYLQPAAGGSFILCNATTPDPPTSPNLAEPYAVMFTVPLGTPNGNYKVYVHNGHGGDYGWSDGLDLVVRDQWVRGSGTISLTPSGGDDTARIQSAINTVTGYANGGTVSLSAGDFILKGQILVKTNVRLAGAGMNNTNLQLQCPPNGTENTSTPSKTGQAVVMQGTNVMTSDLTIHQCYGYSLPSCELWMQPSWMGGGPGGVIANVRVSTDQGDANWQNTNTQCWLSDPGEARGCEFWREIQGGGHSWIHDCTSYGDVGPWYGSESAFPFSSWNNVLENSHIETKNWPTAADGSRNYNWWDYYYKPWVKRVSLFFCEYSYMGHNTTKDVADQDNKGEMVLMHGHDGLWFGEVVSNNGLTMTVRTDGTVNGQVVTMDNYGGGSLTGGGTVPDAWGWWQYNGGRWVVINNGKGIGQIRQVTSVTSNTITVDHPWLVEPDSTSRAIFTGFWSSNIVYDNELNAFPANYIQTSSASVAVCNDGNSYRCVTEGNTSRRTEGGRTVLAVDQGGSYWNEMRDETAIDCHSYAFSSYQISQNPIGPILIGNAFRNCQGNVYEAVSMGAAQGIGIGAIFENMNLSAQVGYNVGFDLGWIPQWPDVCALYRNGTVNVTDTPREPVYIFKSYGEGLLVNNKYTGAGQTYTYASGVSGYSLLKPVVRVARFTGNVGYPVQNVLIPVTNGGTMPVTWTAVPSDPWITASVQANASLTPENTLGRLAISVDTTGLPAGRNWGSVSVSGDGQSVKVGVCVDLAAGPPANQRPHAAFTSTPSAGTAPAAVTFNASSSYDPDGSIQSYYWDFGDGGYGTGVAPIHVYAGSGLYTAALTVTDNSGGTDSVWANSSVSPPLTTVSLAGSPTGTVSAGSPVTFTATADGGYQTLYKFLVKTGSGWTTLRDYQTSNTCTWTPAVAGYYEVKVWAKASDSPRAYDTSSGILSYPIGLISSTGIKLWLKSDSGVINSGVGKVSEWDDQSGSGNNLSQTNTDYMPSVVSGVVNGRPAVRFSGGNQMLQTPGLVLSGSTSFTSFEVVKFSSLRNDQYQYIWWNGADTISGGYGSWVPTTPYIKCGWGSSDKAITYPSAVVLGSWYQVTSRYGSNSHQMWVNGSYLSGNTKVGSNLTGGFFSLGNFGPSSYQGMSGDIAEMLIYNRNLTDTERASVESYLNARWVPPAPVVLDRLRDVKALADGVTVSISSSKVAIAASGAYSDGGIYLCEADRTAGMKATGAGTVNLWENLSGITGTTDTDSVTGERVLRISSPPTRSAGAEMISLGMSGKAFTPSGQLVRVWGKVTAVTASYLTLDDGSGSPVRVELDGLSAPLSTVISVGNYVSATGPAGIMSGGYACVRPRSDSDIRVY